MIWVCAAKSLRRTSHPLFFGLLIFSFPFQEHGEQSYELAEQNQDDSLFLKSHRKAGQDMMCLMVCSCVHYTIFYCFVQPQRVFIFMAGFPKLKELIEIIEPQEYIEDWVWQAQDTNKRTAELFQRALVELDVLLQQGRTERDAVQQILGILQRPDTWERKWGIYGFPV